MNKLILVLVLSGFGLGGVQLIDVPSDEPATKLAVVNHWINKAEVETDKSDPVQFDLKLTVPMPTPGYELKVDEVSKPDNSGHIVVKITGTPPDGMVAQVITNAETTAKLGSLKLGRYAIEIWYRKADQKTYELRDVLMYDAR